jgi:hypothetical protein
MGIQVSPTQAAEILAINMKANLVTFMKGSPSTGKSSIVRQLAKDYNLKLIDLRLAQCDPTDLLGFPFIDQAVDKARYVPMATFPLEGEDLPKDAQGKDMAGWLLFLDEMNGADRTVQKASYKLLLDREVGDKSLHSRVRIIAAGNLDTDGALVEEMSSAIKSRICHLTVRPDHDAWLNWARNNNIDFRITSHVEFKPQNLYNFDPDKSEAEDTYACYRTWEFADKQLKQIPDIKAEKNALAIFAGSLGEGVAREFLAYLTVFTLLPKFADIIANPTKIKVPTEPGQQFALAGSLGQNAAVTNIDPVMKFINRLPLEFQVITLREMLQRTMPLLQEQPVQDWLKVNGDELY